MLELANQQQATRQGALERVRSAAGEIRGLTSSFASCTASFLSILDQAPVQAVVHYEPTRGAILSKLNHVKATRGFLVHGKWSERVLAGPRICDKATVAREILGRASGASEEALCQGAVRVLDGRARELERSIAALDAAREAVLGRAKSLLNCVSEMLRHTVIAPDDRAAADLQEALSLVFWRSTPGVKRVERLLTTTDERATFRGFLQATLDAIAEHAACGTAPAIERQRRHVLKETARELTARLAAWRPSIGFSRAERAILALHFTFTAARSGLGGLPIERIARYEAELDAAPAQDVRSALKALLHQGLLREEDVDVLRYTPSVWQAAQRLRRDRQR